MSAVIISDLDGSLLDHHSYSFTAALPALDALKKLGITVILNTSKTLAETQEWVTKLALDAPFVVENGAAIHNPDGSLWQALGIPRTQLLSWLQMQRQQHGYRFSSFHDMHAASLSELCGLSREQAAAAMERQWSEPLQWQDDEVALDRFKSAAEQAGYQLLRGGRFFSLQGAHDKAAAVEKIGDLLTLQPPPKTIALGDGENDAKMLASVDLGIWIRSPSHPLPHNRQTGQLISSKLGPAGWNEMIMQLINTGFFEHG